MQVVLRIETSAGGNRQAVIRAGQVLRVGRTEWADFCVEDDESMADVHFSIACDASGCRVSDLGSGQTTLLNDEAVTESLAYHGDRITAGNTTFLVQVRDDSGAAVKEKSAEDAAANGTDTTGGDSGYVHVATVSAAEVCKQLDFDDPALALLDKAPRPSEFVAGLAKNERFADAVRFLAHALPKREAVWWAARCVEDVLNESRSNDQAALAAARQWASDDSEDNRQAAGAAAEATKLNTAAGMTAQSAFWSGGSIAGPDAPAMPPDEMMTARGIAGAVLMAAFEDETQDPQDLLRQSVEYGTQVADGQLRWEEASTE